MRLSLHTAAKRKGFTLVELLVVISILAVLMGLLIPAVFNLLSKGPQLKTADEIQQLKMAVQNFCQEYNVKYIPSRIALCENYAGYAPAAGDTPDITLLKQKSVEYLVSLWPHIADTGGPWKTPPGFIDWNGNNVLDGPVILEGDQCLVFFLGGIPLGGVTPAVGGFGNNQRNPAAIASNAKRPHYEFKGDRLRYRPTSKFPASLFYSYYDHYSTGDPSRDKPYAYFSSYGRRNGYDIYFNPNLPPTQQVHDCATIHLPLPSDGILQADGSTLLQDLSKIRQLLPFSENPPPSKRFHNPEGFQIISAGADRHFGWSNALPAPLIPVPPPITLHPFGIWSPSLAEFASQPDTLGNSVPDPNAKGYLRDDQTNFHGQLMGNGG